MILPTVRDPEIQQVFDVIGIKLGPFLERILAGEGTPEGAVAAPVGTLFLRSDGGAATTLYVKEAGAPTSNTGWQAK